MPAVACAVCGGDAGPGRAAALVAANELAVALAGLGAAQLTLRGGDLLARPEALDLLAAARHGGAHALELWTQAPALARPGVAQAVVRAGATAIAVPLYADTAAGHDFVTGQPGHFQRTLAALQAIRQAGAQPIVLAPLLRPSYRQLPLLVQKCVPAGVAGVRLLALSGQDRMPHPLLAPLALVGPAVRAAVRTAQAARRPVQVLGVPACVLGDEAAALVQPKVEVPAGLSAAASEHGRPCADCSWRNRCPGVTEGLVRQHGWVGLEARGDE
jgi:MoaA/NifB/PqqE/SkfB family radical SAM enzyme